MEDMTCGDDDKVEGADIKTTDQLLRELLTRVALLEQQVTSCLESQPLLYQVADKCNKQEVDVKNLKKWLDRRFEEVRSELTNLYRQPDALDVSPLDGSESADEGQNPEWHPEEEGLGHDYDSADVKPYQCKFCPEPQRRVFDGPEGLAEHYTSQHSIPVSITEPLKRRTRAGMTALFEQSNGAKKKEVYAEAIKQITTAGVGDHACPNCSRTYLAKANLTRHMISVHAAPSLSCEFCGKRFNRKDKLKTHQLSIHGKISTALKKKRLRVDAVAALGLDPEPDPAASVHSDSLPPSHRRVLCPECGRSVSRHHLPQHLRTHSDEKSHVCETCGAGYKRKLELTIHQRRHTGERPYKCTHIGCEKRFTSKASLRSHLFLHTGKPFVCDECGGTFVRSWMLRMHKKRHGAASTSEGGAAAAGLRTEDSIQEGAKGKRRRIRATKPKPNKRKGDTSSEVQPKLDFQVLIP